jgi:hypothetical protein
MATPGGKSVPFSIVPHTSLEGVNFGFDRVVSNGIKMMTTNRAAILNDDPTELNMAIHLVGMLQRPAWRHIIKVVKRKI